MFDMSNLTKRYYSFKFEDGRTIDVEPPKLKVLKKIANFSKLSTASELTEDDISSLSLAISLALSKNKQNLNITPEYIEDHFNLDTMFSFLTDYFNWVSEIQNAKN